MADGCAQPTRTRGILRREPRACLRHTSYKSIDFLPNHNLHGTRQNSKPAGLLSAAPTLTLPHRGRELIGCKNSNSFITIHMRYGSVRRVGLAPPSHNRAGSSLWRVLGVGCGGAADTRAGDFASGTARAAHNPTPALPHGGRGLFGGHPHHGARRSVRRVGLAPPPHNRAGSSLWRVLGVGCGDGIIRRA